MRNTTDCLVSSPCLPLAPRLRRMVDNNGGAKKDREICNQCKGLLERKRRSHLGLQMAWPPGAGSRQKTRDRTPRPLSQSTQGPGQDPSLAIQGPPCPHRTTRTRHSELRPLAEWRCQREGAASSSSCAVSPPSFAVVLLSLRSLRVVIPCPTRCPSPPLQPMAFPP